MTWNDRFCHAKISDLTFDDLRSTGTKVYPNYQDKRHVRWYGSKVLRYRLMVQKWNVHKVCQHRDVRVGSQYRTTTYVVRHWSVGNITWTVQRHKNRKFYVKQRTRNSKSMKIKLCVSIMRLSATTVHFRNMVKLNYWTVIEQFVRVTWDKRK